MIVAFTWARDSASPEAEAATSGGVHCLGEVGRGGLEDQDSLHILNGAAEPESRLSGGVNRGMHASLVRLRIVVPSSKPLWKHEL